MFMRQTWRRQFVMIMCFKVLRVAGSICEKQRAGHACNDAWSRVFDVAIGRGAGAH